MGFKENIKTVNPQEPDIPTDYHDYGKQLNEWRSELPMSKSKDYSWYDNICPHCGKSNRGINGKTSG